MRPARERAAKVRRREVEARLIGLTASSVPEWWPDCWERGVVNDLSEDALFDELTHCRPEVRVLHHVRLPGTDAPIDHVVVGGGGVVVAGTEHSDGRVRTDGISLRVRGRDRSVAVDVALWRAEAVGTVLARRGHRGVPVHGVLHWEHVDRLGDRAICLRGVPLLSAGATVAMAARGDVLSPLGIERIVATLSSAELH